MKNEEVRQFLRFTAGSSVLVVNRISVTFNNLSGLACRPIVHTWVFLRFLLLMCHM